MLLVLKAQAPSDISNHVLEVRVWLFPHVEAQRSGFLCTAAAAALFLPMVIFINSPEAFR